MASLVKNGSTYGLIWTDSSRRKTQTRESLKTDDLKTARRRKAHLENLYWEGEHDPWQRKWYKKKHELSVTIPGAVEEFIKYKSKVRGREGWNSRTAGREKYVMRKFARITGNIPIDRLTEKHLEDFYYRDGVTSDHTRNGDYISVTTFLNWCKQNGYLENPPSFRPSRPQTKLPKFITVEELAQLIQYRVEKIKSDLTYNVTSKEQMAVWVPLGWMILVGTGMRPGELARLKLSHIRDGYAVVGEDFTTKNRKERMVPFLFEAGPAVEILCEEKFRRLSGSLRDSDLLLGRTPELAKNKMSKDFTHAWKTCFPDSPRRTLYNLKDTFAIRFLSDESIPSGSGMKLNELREILGHSSLETTQKYLKAIPYGTRIQGTIWEYSYKNNSQ